MDSLILYEIADAVATITLNRPQSLNSLDHSLAVLREQQCFASSAVTEDFAEGVRAFVETRKPVLRGA